MPAKRERLWTRDELIVAFNLYCKIPFGRIEHRNPQIIWLAKIIGRTPSSLTWKLANFARLDPSLQARGIKGASHGSKGELEVWNQFNENWEALAFESERLLAQMSGQSLEQLAAIDIKNIPEEGKERERLVKVRVNQQFFRSAVLAAYNYQCCITGISIPEVLSASHIAPWSVDQKNRMNPRNGLCFNAVHHRAFDVGLITITPDFRIKLSSILKRIKHDDAVDKFFFRYENEKIRQPSRFSPDPRLLKRHASRVFVA